MKNRIVQALLTVVAALHLIPATAVISRHRVEQLYGITVPDYDTELLLRHRAVLFAVLGGALIAAVFVPRWRLPAILGALISAASWVGLATTIGTENAALDRVTRVDALIVGALIGAALLQTD